MYFVRGIRIFETIPLVLNNTVMYEVAQYLWAEYLMLKIKYRVNVSLNNVMIILKV